ncbi:MAG TPA: MFS transporter [Steroidobacteraceae bacterium]|jgi:sugar phosphate permease|nr:MFS transporter [Steroidobacteraceae bacterium]
MRKPHYAWAVLAVTFLVLLTSAAMRSTPGVLIVPLEHEFGWSRATISFAISVNLLLYGLLGPFAAGLVQRYGPRRVMAASALMVGIGALATVTMRHPWQLVALWGVVIGAGTGIVAIVLGATIVQRWFETNRGLALGLLTASSATGQLLFLPVLAQIVVTRGWRSAVIIMSLVALALIPIVLIWMRDRPADLGLVPYGREAGAPAGPVVAGNPFAAAISSLRLAARSRVFWILAGTFFICGASTNGLIGTHLIPACMDHGIPEVRAAGLLAMMGLFDLIGTTGSGWLSDRFDSRWLLLAYYGLRGLSLLYLPTGLISEGHGLSLFAVFYGLDWIATVPPTVALTRQEFGAERAGLVFGWIFAAHQVGAALATTVAGIIRTTEGSYDRAFVLAGALCVMAAVAVLFAGRRPSRAGLVAGSAA